MKMADSEKTEEFLDAESPPECPVDADPATASVKGGEQEEQDSPKTETTPTTSSPPREKEGGGDQSPDPGLLSMPCLMKELHRDSPEESQHGGASTGSDRPVSRHVYESDSSNACMASPSSSGHLADSDTLSSGEERSAPQVGGGGAGESTNMEAGGEPGQATGGGQTSAAVTAGGRKSRRSRSESETPSNAMAAKKNRCQPSSVAAAAAAAGALGQEKQTNGKLSKVKGHRSQKHKERMRLLRQKREAAARKKYNLLQDSSTSDSELTCDSSTSSSDDDDDDDGTSGGGGSKTINTDIPDGPPVVGHYDISDTDSNQESMSMETCVRATVIKHELKTHRDHQDIMAAHSGCIRALSAFSGHMEAELSHREGSQHKGPINVASSDSEVEIVGVQENTRCAHPCGGVIKSLSSWKANSSAEPLNSSSTTRQPPQQPQLWTSISPQPNWVSPPEVVDLTLDEDTSGHKYLL